MMQIIKKKSPPVTTPVGTNQTYMKKAKIFKKQIILNNNFR